MQRLSGQEICGIVDSFKKHAVCVRVFEPCNVNEEPRMTVTTKAGEITGDCEGSEVLEIKDALFERDFVLVDHYGESAEEANYIYPDSVEALSDGKKETIRVKFYDIKGIKEIPSSINAFEMSVLLANRRCNSLESIAVMDL